MIEYIYDKEAGLLTCNFSGRMDFTKSRETRHELETKVAALLAERGDDEHTKSDLKIIFDLGGVDYFASEFLRAYLTLARRVKAGHLVIRNASENLKKILGMAGLHSD
jgi:anti-anti-sigma factor